MSPRVQHRRSRAVTVAQVGLGSVAVALLAGVGVSAVAAPAAPPDEHAHHHEEGAVTTSGETVEDAAQQAVAAGGTRDGDTSENSLDLSSEEIAAAVDEQLPTGPPPVVQGPTDLDPLRHGEWDHDAVRMPEAATAPGAASAPGAIHTVLLATGKVLVVAGSGNQWMNLQGSSFTTWLWAPSVEGRAAWTQVPTPWDVFCAGHTTLPNGDVLVNGGTTAYPVYDDATGELLHDWDGSKESYVFDISEERYVRAADMAAARWYPTTLTLGDGSALTVGGLSDEARDLGVVSHNTDLVEHFDPGSRTWSQAPRMNFTTADPSVPTQAAGPNETRTFPYYPGLTLLEDGTIFYSGASNGANGIMPGIWDWRTGDFRNVDRIPLPYQRNSAATVLLPPAQDQKVMVMGGGDWSEPTTADTQVIDLKGGTAGPWVQGPPLTAPKMYVGAVILPDSTVFETNGAARFREGGVRTAGLYDPEAGTMTEMNSPVVDRLYHSEAFLLPDGRVAALGSQPLDGTMDLDISLFSPTYLTSGAERPVVTGPGTVFGAEALPFDVALPEGTSLEGAALLRPSATTHSTDPDQRLVDLVVQRTGEGTYRFSAPTNRNLLPPGQYMLVVTDSAGTPSEAVWVSVDVPTVNPAPAPDAPDPDAPDPDAPDPDAPDPDAPDPDAPDPGTPDEGTEAPAEGLGATWTMQGWEARITTDAGAAGRDVHLEERVGQEWEYRTNDVTGSDGSVTMTWGGGGAKTFRLRVVGTDELSAPFRVVYGTGPTSGSTQAGAPVGRTLALDVTTGGWEARFTARSSTARAGQDVVLEQLVDGQWSRATNAPTGEHGVTPPMVWGGGGTHQFRAVLPDDGDLDAATSPVVTVTYGP
ncbi:galactose oxidase early set domain-containing protein [Pseudokineococcus sp. 1T1Z-3]|uniref:galactose oxidase early set domain-containing protein n=1 Tax=Pseudokineococcus sp. 1T1Z-3 TaxID=3132745 RepID=UPI00309E9E7C